MSATDNDDGDEGKLFGLALGGEGGKASSGDLVSVSLDAESSIQTLGTDTTPDTAAHGILAQSIGGGGGSGGFGVSGNLKSNTQAGTAALITVGATGGTGGAGGQVQIEHYGGISVAGDFGSGIIAQSIGGGGGNAGLAIGGNLKTQQGFDILLGGNGGGGNAKPGGEIDVTATGGVSTAGDAGHAIVMQSIGGGGGTANATFVGGAAQEAGGGMAVTLGGMSGQGGAGGPINFNYQAQGPAQDLQTEGNAAIGLLAQSIGGGGGASVTQFGGASDSNSQINLAVGVQSGNQNQSDGGAVNITNLAAIEAGMQGADDSTRVQQSHGVVAQSIGAGGGLALTTGSLSFPAGTIVNQTAGASEVEGNSAAVALDNQGKVTTYGVDSHALVVQSIGGGGGIVASTAELELSSPDLVSYKTNLGGTGSDNRSAAIGKTQVKNSAALTTQGDGSFGILAQNISGGGGYSSSLFGIDAALAGPESYTVETGLTGSGGFSNRLGGKNVVTKGQQDGNDVSGSLEITNSADITTMGRGATAILAQSIGGGGGVAFDGGWNAKNDAPFKALTTNYAVGGDGVSGENNNSMGASGNAVTVTHTAGAIKTSGFGASGIYAQSIGGGGGRGLVGGVTNDGSAPTVGGTNNAEGYGGAVSVTVSEGATITVGANDNTYAVTAFGVLAQSVGGGGGHGGVTDFQGATAGTKPRLIGPQEH